MIKTTRIRSPLDLYTSTHSTCCGFLGSPRGPRLHRAAQRDVEGRSWRLPRSCEKNHRTSGRWTLSANGGYPQMDGLFHGKSEQSILKWMRTGGPPIILGHLKWKWDKIYVIWGEYTTYHHHMNDISKSFDISWYIIRWWDINHIRSSTQNASQLSPLGAAGCQQVVQSGISSGNQNMTIENHW